MASNVDVLEGHNAENIFGYLPPTQAGRIPFTPPGTSFECETAYWLWGDLSDPNAPPLIVLHGGPGAPGRDWKAVTLLHAKYGVPVLLYDQIGCGASTHLRETRGDMNFWTMKLFLDELENVRTHLKIETFDLLGHSCGGMIAVSYTLTQPKGLRKLVIASSPASDVLRLGAFAQQEAALPQDMRDAMQAYEKGGRQDSPEYQRAAGELMRRHLCRLDPWPAEMKEVMALMEEDDTILHSLYGPERMKPNGSWKDYDVQSRLQEITEKTVPGGVLLTNGKYDMTPDNVMVPFFVRVRARVKWMQFAESSHMPHLEEPQAYLTALGDFLKMA